MVTKTHYKHEPSCQFSAVAFLCPNSQLIKLHEKRLFPLTRASLYTIAPNVAPLHTNNPLLLWSGRSWTLKIKTPFSTSSSSYSTFILCASFSTFCHTRNVNPLSCLESRQVKRKCGNVAIPEQWTHWNRIQENVTGTLISRKASYHPILNLFGCNSYTNTER